MQSANCVLARRLKCVSGLLCWAFGSTLGCRNIKYMKHRNETCSDIFRLKNKKRTGKNAVSVQTETKLLVARQVMHPKY